MYAGVTMLYTNNRRRKPSHNYDPNTNKIWECFLAGGLMNPLEVMEQLAYL